MAFPVMPPCRRLMCTLLIALGTIAAGAPAAQQDDAAQVLERVSAYAKAFIQNFSNVVASESYAQSRVGIYGGVPRRQQLVSELYFVRASEAADWIVFRDVASIDGRPVRRLEQGIVSLLMEGAESPRALADRVATESARHYLFGWPTMSNPLLGILILQDQYRDRFRFSLGPGTDLQPGQVELRFDERVRPTLFRDGARDAVLWGGLHVVASTGRVVHTAVHLSEGRSAVAPGGWRMTFGVDERLGIDVPLQMTESHGSRSSAFYFRGTATYTDFRRFGVTTNATPQPGR